MAEQANRIQRSASKLHHTRSNRCLRYLSASHLMRRIVGGIVKRCGTFGWQCRRQLAPVHQQLPYHANPPFSSPSVRTWHLSSAISEPREPRHQQARPRPRFRQLHNAEQITVCVIMSLAPALASRFPPMPKTVPAPPESPSPSSLEVGGSGSPVLPT
jgi:hypothetical protein